VDNGGQVWVCGTCAKPRGVTDARLIDGARIVTAAYVAQYLAAGAASIAF
jgi:sulfur relay (sulfurtransferase) complex TusBCD TusD component (DsrE family)